MQWYKIPSEHDLPRAVPSVGVISVEHDSGQSCDNTRCTKSVRLEGPTLASRTSAVLSKSWQMTETGITDRCIRRFDGKDSRV